MPLGVVVEYSYEMRRQFVAVGLNALFVVLPHWKKKHTSARVSSFFHYRILILITRQ